PDLRHIFNRCICEDLFQVKHNRPSMKLPKILLALPFLFACGESNEQPAAQTTTGNTPRAGQSAVVDDKSEPTVVGVAVKSPDHKSLVSEVTHLKYEDYLSKTGPFSMYPPTDAVFNVLHAHTLDNHLKHENKATLENMLEYHVALGE